MDVGGDRFRFLPLKAADEVLDQAIASGPEVLSGFRVYGNSGMVGDTYTKNIFYLEAIRKGAVSPRSLLNGIETQAIQNGAQRISVIGHAVVENRLFNPAILQRWGWNYQRINSETIHIFKTLP